MKRRTYDQFLKDNKPPKIETSFGEEFHESAFGLEDDDRDGDNNESAEEKKIPPIPQAIRNL